MSFISKEFAAALVAAQKATKIALKDAENPHFKKAYADLGSVFAACKEAYNSNGITILQRCGSVTVEGGNGFVEVTTSLVHEGGEILSDGFRIGLKDPYDPQKIGSAITYARRYGLSAICGVVADEDDDGNAAARAGEARRSAAPTTAAKPAQPSPEASAGIARGLVLLAACAGGQDAPTDSDELKGLVKTIAKDPTRVASPDWQRLYDGAVALFKAQ